MDGLEFTFASQSGRSIIGIHRDKIVYVGRDNKCYRRCISERDQEAKCMEIDGTVIEIFCSPSFIKLLTDRSDIYIIGGRDEMMKKIENTGIVRIINPTLSIGIDVDGRYWSIERDKVVPLHDDGVVHYEDVYILGHELTTMKEEFIGFTGTDDTIICSHGDRYLALLTETGSVYITDGMEDAIMVKLDAPEPIDYVTSDESFGAYIGISGKVYVSGGIDTRDFDKESALVAYSTIRSLDRCMHVKYVVMVTKDERQTNAS